MTNQERLMDFRVIIPVRYASTRLPGKPLLDIGGKPMIQHVYERAIDSCAESVVIATDDDRIRLAAEKFGAKVCMTSSDHRSGTERLAEAVTALGYEEDEIIVNVQGDSPLISPKNIQQVAGNLEVHDTAKMTTLCEHINDVEDMSDPSVVKVVFSKRGYALYFSRATIPWDQAQSPAKEDADLEASACCRHIGLYAYRVGFLSEYMRWEPCPYEELESLEQLRALWNGVRIHVAVAHEKSPPEVNTEADLVKVRALL